MKQRDIELNAKCYDSYVRNLGQERADNVLHRVFSEEDAEAIKAEHESN